MVLGEAFHRRVVKQLAQRLNELGKQALLLFDPTNIRYVTGLSLIPTDRPVALGVWADERVALFVPQLEVEYVGTTWIRDIRWYAEYPVDGSLLAWMAREVGGPLLVDAPSAQQWGEMSSEIGDVELGDPVAELRQVKTPAEIDLIERAAGYADVALERTFARLTTGSPEWDVLADVVAAVDSTMRTELGDLYDASSPAITGTIQSGLRAALPNAPTSGRQLARGDNVIVEYTVKVGGYNAVSGCTFFVGDPLRDVVQWVEAAVHAQAAAREAMRPGMSGHDVDAAARQVLERHSLGDGIRHRTGHGTGRSPREAPWLVESSTTPLQPGMVVVNQPGVYVPGRTGTRNAETVVIEEHGPRVLNPRADRWRDLEARLKEF